MCGPFYAEPIIRAHCALKQHALANRAPHPRAYVCRIRTATYLALRALPWCDKPDNTGYPAPRGALALARERFAC
jgi:hypothetical protein